MVSKQARSALEALCVYSMAGRHGAGDLDRGAAHLALALGEVEVADR